jgi:class 3 adenylate cyclase/predicted ATPase
MTCGSCGTVNGAGSRFCSSCGHALVTRSDERRIATVVFADLARFTTLAEKRDPEQVKNLVDTCFERLAADVHAFGGQVDKVLGDAIIALFGAPVAHEDDPERAVRAALRMQESIATFAAERGLDVQMRVGVNTGEVLVGSLRAAGEYTAMGDVVNTAQRLQVAAEPGAIVVGRATYTATRDAIAYEPLGEVSAKGRTQAVEAWVARHALLPPGYRRRHQQTAFVGRDEEVRLLAGAVDLGVARSRAHVGLVLGDAGVGKSRLAEEVAEHARSRHGALVLEGRCVPYGEVNVWWPIAESLRAACGLSADDPLPTADHQATLAVVEVLGSVHPSVEAKRTVNGLLYLMGYEVSLRDIDPARARDEAVRSVLVFIEAAARNRPVLMVLSDLHWADQLVLELVDALIERLSRAPFVLLATARSELFERWTLPPGRHNDVLLTLDPLGRDAAAKVLDGLVDHDLDTSVREALLDRGGGNPFFLEELVALLGETDGGAGALLDATSGADPSSLAELPDTLRGLVAARLDGLEPAERSVLEDAAVWGRSGPVEALERMAVDIHGVHDVGVAVAALADKEILVLDAGRWSFHSDLIRDVAYGTLTKTDRALRHAGVASYLERAQPDRHDVSDRAVDVIAWHFGAAADLVDDLGSVEGIDREVLLDHAVDWLVEAARRAQVTQAITVAIRLASQALRLCGPEPTARRIGLLLTRAAARAQLRELDGARADVSEATAQAAELDDAPSRARALLVTGEVQQRAGELDEARATLDRAVEAFLSIGDPHGESESLRALGMTQIFSGDHDAAEQAISRALARSSELDDRRGVAWAQQHLAWISFVEGRPAEAEQRLSESATTFTELGDTGGLSWSLGLLAFVRYNEGDYDEALSLSAQVLTDARQRGDRWGEGMMLLVTAGVNLWSGRAAQAVTDAQGALGLFRAIGDAFGEAQAVGALARARATGGDVAGGSRLIDAWMDGARDTTAVDLRVGAATAAACLATQVGDPVRAEAALAAIGDVPHAPGGLGGTERYVAEGFARLQLGDLPTALDRLLVAVDADESAGHVDASPYARSVLALAAAVARDDDRVRDLTALVAASPRATYLDRLFCSLASALVTARCRLPDADGQAAAVVNAADATDDLVAQAVARLGAAAIRSYLDQSDAGATRVDAEERLALLGIDAVGWRRVFAAALA